MAYRDYLTSEVAEDWVDGLIDRREAIRRLALLGLSMSAAVTLLAACAEAARPSGASNVPGVGTSVARSAAAPTSPSGASPSGGPGATAVAGSAVRFPGPRGDLQAWLAEAAAPRGAMLVIHENRGLTDHIRSVASRLAGDGYTSLAIDLLSEEGGTDSLGQGNVQAALAGASEERFAADMRAGVDELVRRVPGAKVGITGFCFGGGMVWTLLDAVEPRLAAAVPFYGPAPDAPTFAGNKAAVFAIYAELDNRVNATRDRVLAALDAAGLTHETRTYPGVDHAFFNDTGGRYNATQAAAAYADMLVWLQRYLGA
jgi:carboxymethylenebutenolidase